MNSSSWTRLQVGLRDMAFLLLTRRDRHAGADLFAIAAALIGELIEEESRSATHGLCAGRDQSK